MTPGSSMMLPRGVPHMFHNPFDEETRIIARRLTPAGWRSTTGASASCPRAA